MTTVTANTTDAPFEGSSPADPLLVVEDLHASAADTEILRGVDLVVRSGELHAVMGPNGSGKSTLANVLLGSPGFQVTKGKVLFRGEDITGLATDVRAKKGIFLAFQYPEEIPGVPIAQFLRQAVAARRGTDVSVIEVRVQIHEWLQRLGMDAGFASRYLNDGLLRRGEEAQRDPPDGSPGAGPRDPRRDRLRARHRRHPRRGPRCERGPRPPARARRRRS